MCNPEAKSEEVNTFVKLIAIKCVFQNIKKANMTRRTSQNFHPIKSQFVILLTITLIKTVHSVNQCVWYDKCGPDPDFGDTEHDLNCVYNGPPSKSFTV